MKFLELQKFYDVMVWRHFVTSHHDAMWHHVTSCDIMWYHVTSCDIMWHYVTSCDIMWRHVTSCDVMWRHVTSLTSRDIMWHHVTSRDMPIYGIMWWHQNRDTAGPFYILLIVTRLLGARRIKNRIWNSRSYWSSNKSLTLDTRKVLFHCLHRLQNYTSPLWIEDLWKLLSRDHSRSNYSEQHSSFHLNFLACKGDNELH